MIKQWILPVFVLCCTALRGQDGNLLDNTKWQFNDPARITRLPDNSFELNSPDGKAFAEMRQTVELGQTEVRPITFRAAFRTLEGNEYYRKEASYAAYLNLVLDNGKVIHCVMVGPTPAKKDWEILTRTYRAERPVKKAVFVITFRKRAGKVAVRDLALLLPRKLSSAGMINHGVGVASCELRHSVAGKDATGRPFVIAAALDAGPDNYLLYTELDTGKTFQYFVPVKGGYFSAAVLTPKGKYVTSIAGKVIILDVNTRKLTVCKGPDVGMPCWSAALGNDGTVYLGLVPCMLAAVDPETAEVKKLGRMDPVETQLYAIACDKAGWIYCGNGMARSGVVAYNLKTGEKKELVPEQFRKLGSGYAARLPDGQVFISTPSGFSAVCEAGEIWQTPVTKKLPEEPVPHLKYGTKLHQIDDTRRVLMYDMNRKFIIWRDGNTVKTVPFTYKSGGVSLTSLAAGPDGKIYISSAHPHHLASLDPATGKITDHGYNPLIGGGNFCNMTSFNGKLYACQYAHGRMWELDPFQPVSYAARGFFGVSMSELIARNPALPDRNFSIVGEILLCQGQDNGTPFYFPLPVEKAGKYFVNMRFYYFPTYGEVTVSVAGKEHTFNLCSKKARMGEIITLGPFDLPKGEFPVEMRVKRRPEGKYPWFGLTGLEIAPAPRKEAGNTANPRIIAEWPREVRRPRTIQVHPNGREIMMAGYSYDGMDGGMFGILDLQTGKTRVIADWLPGESCKSGVFAPTGDLLGGTAIDTHGGHKSNASAAAVFRMDWQTGKILALHRCAGANKVIDVVLWQGKLLAAANSRKMLVLEPDTLQVLREYSIGYPVRRAFRKTEDGRLFLIQDHCLSEIDPVTFRPVKFAAPLAPITAGGAIADGRIYFACSDREVHSCKIPERKK
ncbi:MAG: hypothetical protein IJV89_08250 [Lentisphaeria bacterium]|nr:hypothetical protein [Lentisphaeria bacterium]